MRVDLIVTAYGCCSLARSSLVYQDYRSIHASYINLFDATRATVKPGDGAIDAVTSTIGKDSRHSHCGGIHSSTYTTSSSRKEAHGYSAPF